MQTSYSLSADYELTFLPDLKKPDFLQLHPELISTKTIDDYIRVATNPEVEIYRPADMDREGKVQHRCNKIRGMESKEPYRGCYCGIDTQFSHASAAYYLAKELKDSRRQVAAYEILKKRGLLYRWETEGDWAAPFSIAQQSDSQYRLALVMRDLRFWFDAHFIRLYNVTVANSGLDLIHRFGFDPTLNAFLGSTEWNWDPAAGFPPRTNIMPVSMIRSISKQEGMMQRLINRWKPNKSSSTWKFRPCYSNAPSQEFHEVTTIALHPNEPLAAVGVRGGLLRSGKGPSRLVRMLWEAIYPTPALDEVFRLEVAQYPYSDSWQLNIIFSPSGRLIALQTGNLISVWKVHLESQGIGLEQVWEKPVGDYKAGIAFVAGEQLGMWDSLHSGSLVVSFYDTSSWTKIREIIITPKQDSASQSNEFVTALNPEGTIMTVESVEVRNYVRFFDTTSGRELYRWDLKDPATFWFIYSTPKIWNGVKYVETYKQVEERSGWANTKAVFSPREPSVAIGTIAGSSLLLNMNTQEIRVLHGHSGPVCQVAFSPDGRMLMSASRDGTLAFWSV